MFTIQWRFMLRVIFWAFMMAIQIHHPYSEIHIVAIPCHLVESLQATTSSFVLFLIFLALQLDSDWNTMQQVRDKSPYKVDSVVVFNPECEFLFKSASTCCDLIRQFLNIILLFPNSSLW